MNTEQGFTTIVTVNGEDIDFNQCTFLDISEDITGRDLIRFEYKGQEYESFVRIVPNNKPQWPVEVRDEFMDKGWPGDGSGMDDLADYNQNEQMDYRDE
jgi:hypothetical protein